MMRPRWHKVLADLWSHKVRSFLVIVSIAVGLFAVGMIISLYVLLKNDMMTSYIAVNPANIQIRSSNYEQDFVERIRHLAGVKDAMGAMLLDVRLKTGSDQYIPLNIMALPDIKDMPLNKVTLLQGTWPPGDKEIVLDINKFSDTHAKLGDEIEIKLPSGTVRKMRLVGIVQDLTIGSSNGGGGTFMASLQGYVAYDTVEWLELPFKLNYLYASVSEDSNNLEHIGKINLEILNEFDKSGTQTLNSITHRSTDHPTIMYLDAISSVLIILGLLVVFLSAFLITNTLAALLNQQIQQVGIMKTIGASRLQINIIYVVLIFIFSLLALLISIPLSAQAAYLELQFLAVQINFKSQGFRIVPLAIYAQALIALIVPQIAGAIPILQGSRSTIQDAISGEGTAKFDDRRGLNRWLATLKLFDRPMRISLRNTFRRRIRLILTLVTLILGGGIFIATFNVRYTLDDYVGRLGKYFLADVNLTLDRPYRTEEIQRVLQDMPDIVAVEGWAAARAEIMLDEYTPGENVQMQGPPVDSELIQPIMLKGRWIKPGDENAIVLSELFLSKYPDIQIGDTLRLKVNDQKTDWKVVGFFQFAGKNVGLIAYTNYDYLAKITHSPGKSFLYRIVAQDGMHSLENQKAFGRRLEAFLNQKGYTASDIRAGQSLVQSASKGLDTLTAFLMIMALLMALVGSIGLAGTMSLNVMERTREIGVMRAIGATDRAIMKMVIVEGMLIGLISWIFACLVAIPISSILSDVITDAVFDLKVASSFTPMGILIWLVIVVVFSALASIMPARNAARLTIREVLSYE